MIPSKKQFSGWSLPSRVGYVSFVITVVSLVLGFVFWYWPRSTPSDTDEFVRRTSSIRLSLEKVEIQRWLGDDQASLTATIRNESQVPVDGVTFALGDENRDIPQFVSNQMKKVKNELSIDRLAQTSIPVAGIREMEAVLGGHVCGSSVRGPDIREPLPGCPASAAEVRSYLMTLRLSYKTIFRESRKDEFKFWVHTIPGSTG
jgi:hypothetical protein